MNSVWKDYYHSCKHVFILLSIFFFSTFSVIGGWTNSRVLIRRKKSDEVLSQVFIFNMMTPHTPTKFVLEVSNSKYLFPSIAVRTKLFDLIYLVLFAGGNVRIYSDHDKSQPIAAVFDPQVLPVSYVSFAAFDTNVDFFYDCRN